MTEDYLNYVEAQMERWPDPTIQIMALVAIAQQLARVADALEKIHAGLPAEQLATIAEAVDMIAQGDTLPPQR